MVVAVIAGLLTFRRARCPPLDRGYERPTGQRTRRRGKISPPPDRARLDARVGHGWGLPRGGRHIVLRVVFQFAADPPSGWRPRRRKPFVGPAAEQRRAALHHFVDFDLAAVSAAVVLERPTAVLVALRAARILEDPVD